MLGTLINIVAVLIGSAIGLMLLDLRRVRVANYLPALLLAPLFTVALDLLGVRI